MDDSILRRWTRVHNQVSVLWNNDSFVLTLSRHGLDRRCNLGVSETYLKVSVFEVVFLLPIWHLSNELLWLLVSSISTHTHNKHKLLFPINQPTKGTTLLLLWTHFLSLQLLKVFGRIFSFQERL